MALSRGSSRASGHHQSRWQFGLLSRRRLRPDVSPGANSHFRQSACCELALILMVSCWRWSAHPTVSPSTSTASAAFRYVGISTSRPADAGGLATGPARQRERYSRRRAQILTCDELLVESTQE